ncbi:MAG: hypothetical protein ACON4H_17385 [Rubripirellula sp.]
MQKKHAQIAETQLGDLLCRCVWTTIVENPIETANNTIHAIPLPPSLLHLQYRKLFSEGVQ